ncbi:MAG: IS21 family transposase [Syntrophales bacterium]
MLIVETIRKIRLMIQRDGDSIRHTARELGISRNTVRKAVRSQQTAFSYRRKTQPRPVLGAFVERLEKALAEDWKLAKRQRRTAVVLFEQLQAEGYTGSYDSIRRHIRDWRRRQGQISTEVYIPLVFDAGEAFQFDWSHELVEMAGMPVTVKVAQLRLCHSRHFLVIAYPRETQEMVFDAHIRAFDHFGGVCRRGIYDNLKTVVNKILTGKQRSFNNRFGQLSSYYLFEPVACTPAAGWEKGQVENQVGTVRRRFFVPRPKVRDFYELNEYLRERCLQWAKSHPHPDLRDQTVWQVFEAEKAHLLPLPQPFDGYAERPARVSPSGLVSFDRNRYSVDCHHVGRTVQLRVYAGRIVIAWEGQVIGEHQRHFGSGKTIFDPWHYVPALDRKPGALRNGVPFRHWELPEAIAHIGEQLQRRYPDWDRQYVGILQAVPLYGLEAVEAACGKAMNMGIFSKEVVLNLLNRGREDMDAEPIDPPGHLILKQPPVADCQRYDRLRQEVAYATQ